MIIIKIIGGIGNQMFQYAVGRNLALINQTDLKLDLGSFTTYKLRDFELFNLNVNTSAASQNEINNLLPSHNFEKLFQYISPPSKKTYYREKKFSFDKNVLLLGKNVYLKGYFQSEKYFIESEKWIRTEFEFKNELKEKFSDQSSKLADEESVAVHVRQGDFAKDSETSLYHGVLTANYYMNAFELIRNRIANPKFYFFSDDMNWVKKNISLPDAVYVSENLTKNHIEDLYLMSCCKHNIIANSSFSWWGAWLNNNPGKIVIAPKKWFNKGPKDTQDLIPDGWIKI